MHVYMYACMYVCMYACIYVFKFESFSDFVITILSKLFFFYFK